VEQLHIFVELSHTVSTKSDLEPCAIACRISANRLRKFESNNNTNHRRIFTPHPYPSFFLVSQHHVRHGDVLAGLALYVLPPQSQPATRVPTATCAQLTHP
jgi:hypothetical protein